MRNIIPAPWPVLHTARAVDTTIDAHGNSKIVDAAPVVRYVISLYGPGDEMFSAEYLAQSLTVLKMVIPAEDLQFYKSGDQVMIGGAVDAAGDYSGGFAYRLDGHPASEVQGPWPRLYKHFGGTVNIVRAN